LWMDGSVVRFRPDWRYDVCMNPQSARRRARESEKRIRPGRARLLCVENVAHTVPRAAGEVPRQRLVQHLQGDVVCQWVDDCHDAVLRRNQGYLLQVRPSHQPRDLERKVLSAVDVAVGAMGHWGVWAPCSRKRLLMQVKSRGVCIRGRCSLGHCAAPAI